MLDATTSCSTGRSASASSSTPVPTPLTRGVLADLVHALADADPGREVDDAVDPVQRAPHGLRVADVADDELDVGRQVVRALALRVDLGVQHVEDAHALPRRQQLGRQVGADEAGPAGDERRSRHACSLSTIGRCCRAT